MFLPQSEEKNWGRVMHIFASPHAAVSVLKVKSGQRCSTHVHDERANMFVVLDGWLVVEEWPEGLRKASTLKVLESGDIHTVPSRIWHRFRVQQSGKVLEVYWPDQGGIVRLDDIIRKDIGGPDDLNEVRDGLAEHGIIWPV